MEVEHSKAILEERLGNRAEVFAYPYGDDGADPQALKGELERIGYRAACLYRGGPISFPLANPYRLTRLAMGPDTDMEAVLERGGFIPLASPSAGTETPSTKGALNPPGNGSHVSIDVATRRSRSSPRR